MYLCSWEISPELLKCASACVYVCVYVCLCVYMSNQAINVTALSNGPIKRHQLVSDITQLHT